MKHIFILIFAAILMESCTITQEYVFNKDFSGTYISTIDMSLMMNTMKSFDTIGKSNKWTDSIQYSMNEAIVEIEKTGVSNLKYGWNKDTTAICISYSFKNLDELNNAMNSTKSGSAFFQNSKSKSPAYFEKKKNTLIYHSAKIENDSIFNSQQMKSMDQFYKFELIFSFEKEIKSISNIKADISLDKKRVILKGSLFDLVSPVYNSDLIIKFN